MYPDPRILTLMQVSPARSNPPAYGPPGVQTGRNGHRRAVVVWLVLLLAVIIGELLPGDSAPVKALTFRFSDKALHMISYAVLAAWPVYAMRFRAAIVCVAVAEGVGITLEFIQQFIPNRSFDVFDIVANSVGIVTGCVLALALRLYLIKMRPQPRS